MKLSLIVAMSKDGVIGKEGALPWHLPEDLQHFKKITMGSPIIMGRKTFESIGKALPGRENIVITRNAGFAKKGVRTFSSLETALLFLEEYLSDDDTAFVIGGAEIFKEALPKIEKAYVTLIEEKISGDVYFPITHFQKDFTLLQKSEVHFSPKEKLHYTFEEYIQAKKK